MRSAETGRRVGPDRPSAGQRLLAQGSRRILRMLQHSRIVRATVFRAGSGPRDAACGPKRRKNGSAASSLPRFR